MKARPMTIEDIPAVRAIYARSGLEFDFPEFGSELIEAFDVVEDDRGAIVMAASAKRSVEIALICAPGGNLHPMVKLESFRLLHESLRAKIVAKGYSEATAFLAPSIARSFGRHLSRKFSWCKAWTAYVIRGLGETCR